MNIPLHVLDIQDEFRRTVVDYFYEQYLGGRTPNPCIVCNQYIKFGLCFDKALSLDADYFATGHYARNVNYDGIYHLYRGADVEKDQSYFLYTLDQRRLAKILFPLGDYSKYAVNELVQKNVYGISFHRSSQDICFINGKYRKALSRNFDLKSGDVINNRGEIIGRHKGVALYTIGQRHGLGISGSGRTYVTRIEPDMNRITIGKEEELYTDCLTAYNVKWVSGVWP